MTRKNKNPRLAGTNAGAASNMDCWHCSGIIRRLQDIDLPNSLISNLSPQQQCDTYEYMAVITCCWITGVHR